MSKPRYQRIVPAPSAKDKTEEKKIPENGLYIWLRSPRTPLPNQQQAQQPA